MSKLPVKLIELKKREEELQAELSQIIKEEELVESNNSHSSRFKKGIGIIASAIMLLGCLLIYIRLDWSFFKSGDIGYIILNIIAYLFVGMGVAAMISGILDLLFALVGVLQKELRRCCVLCVGKAAMQETNSKNYTKP
jgi:hypothetical protein